MALTDQQKLFLKRHVLDVGSGQPRVAVTGMFTNAKDEVDARIETLRTKMMKHDDPDFAKIAGSALFKTGRKGISQLLAALRDYDKSEDASSAAARLRKTIKAFRKAVLTSGDVGLIDTAPFGVAVEMRATYRGQDGVGLFLKRKKPGLPLLRSVGRRRLHGRSRVHHNPIGFGWRCTPVHGLARVGAAHRRDLTLPPNGVLQVEKFQHRP